MRLLLDGDLFAYRCSASAENENVGIACSRVDLLLDQIITDLNATEYQFYITGPTNFRYQIYPEYKANRSDQSKPKHLADVRNYLLLEHNAIMSDGCEADDLMGIAQCARLECIAGNPFDSGGETMIVSLDKDMLMIPGNHYSWQIEGGSPEKRWKKEAIQRLVSPLDGLRWFYTQMLQGDPSDNIKGVKGIGKVGALHMVGGCTTEREMFDIVRDAYSCDEEMLMNGKVLWIMREKDKQWEFPFETEEL